MICQRNEHETFLIIILLNLINCIKELILNQMLLDYVIITLSEIKTTKGAFTYYIITEGGGGLQNAYAWLWEMGRGLAL